MIMRKALFFSCIALSGIGATEVLAADPPLLSAFKQFCADTQAKPDAVKNAALAFSGKKVATVATNKKAPVSAVGNTWSFVFQGHHLMVTSGTLHAPAAGFGETEFYPAFVDKAAVLIVRLAKNHPLPDGNKRAAWVALRMFVEINGWS